VQAYLEQDEAPRLAGFAAVEAAPGQTVTVRIGIAPKALSHRPHSGGPHRLRVGRSASDLPLTCTIN
jgi:beta-glucosidase